MKKIVSIVGGLIVVVVVAVVLFVFVFAGDAIKVAVEEMGPKLTKSEVKLDKVDLSLASGAAALSGLKVGNPATFTTPHAFKLDNISVKIDTGSIGSDVIVIKEILINAPDVIAEFKKFSFNPLDTKKSIQESLKTSNFIAIQKNVDAFVKQSGGGGKSSGGSSSSDSEKADEPKLIIEKFRMTGVKVRAVSHDGLKMDTSLPPFSISLDNIGKKEKGLPPAEIAAVLIPKVQAAITDAMMGDLTKVAGDLFKNMGGAVKDAAAGAAKAVEGVTKSIGGAAGGAGDAVGDATKGATEGLKKLFGK
ncbi:MAG: hypothetical protein HOF23_06250 [Rhodospirillaceae bacterium]|jgi:hypothetical protein|nr:hypothetical protein [Rhodospirillaceae bacterium]